MTGYCIKCHKRQVTHYKIGKQMIYYRCGNCGHESEKPNYNNIKPSKKFKHIDKELIKGKYRDIYVCMDCSSVVITNIGTQPECNCRN